MIKQKLIVYLGRNSEIDFPVLYNSNPIDFLALGITKVGLEIDNNEYTSDDGFLDINTVGVVKIKLGSLTVEKGEYPCRLIIYSTDYPLGKVIFSEKTDNQISVEFV